jgi:nitrate reductase gamma subunit
MVSRTGILAIFGAIGFAIGFLAFLASPTVANALVSILHVDASIVFALVSGVAGATVSTSVITLWARRP